MKYRLLCTDSEGRGNGVKSTVVYDKILQVFTESAPCLIQTISCDVRVSYVVCCCPHLETKLPGRLETSSQRVYR